MQLFSSPEQMELNAHYFQVSVRGFQAHDPFVKMSGHWLAILQNNIISHILVTNIFYQYANSSVPST